MCKSGVAGWVGGSGWGGNGTEGVTYKPLFTRQLVLVLVTINKSGQKFCCPDVETMQSNGHQSY